MKWLASCISDAGSALWRSFADFIDWLIRRSRSTGSAVSVGSSVIITETRFPKVPICSGVRTDTGMKPSSESTGSSPRSSSHVRSPAVQMARTTSLTVQPKVFLIIFTSSSDIDSNATRRCADMRV